MVALHLVTPEEQFALDALMQLYLHDSSEYTGDDVNHLGRYVYYYLDLYWKEPGRYPFLIRQDGHIAGLALIRLLEDGPDPLHQLAEFFVLRKYRRQGVGRSAAFAVFDRFPGRWEVQQHGGNLAGQAFWQRVITDYTGGDFHDEWRDDEHQQGPVQTFASRPMTGGRHAT